MSSNSSGSSNYSSQDAQIGEIKQVFEFSKMPRSLRIYRVQLLLGFLAIFASTIALLVMNIVSKDNIQSNLVSLYNQKRIRNNFSSAKLLSLLVYTTANLPTNIDTSAYGISELVNRTTISSYFLSSMPDVVNTLQSSLANFAQQ